MVVNHDSHTDGDYDLPPRTGVLKKYDRPRNANNNSNNNKNNINNNSRRIQQKTRLLEVEAYKAVLKAFGAKADGLSWPQNALMTDLRRELRVTDEQHKELLAVANDDVVRKIWELRRQEQKAPPNPPGRKRKKIDDDGQTKGGGGAGLMKKKVINSRAKKPKASPPIVKVEEPAAPAVELLTLEALDNEVARLEIEPDMSRLNFVKQAAHEFKRKVLEALSQCEPDDDDDSEKTEERVPDPPATAQVQFEEKIVKTEEEEEEEEEEGEGEEENDEEEEEEEEEG